MYAIKVYDNDKKEGDWHYLGAETPEGKYLFYSKRKAEIERDICDVSGYAGLDSTEIVEVYE